MKDKVQVPLILGRFVTMVGNQFNKKVKAIRSDNGSEFLSTASQALFGEHGIEHQRSCTYTPQQNGVVERKHRTILQLARALLFQSGMTTDFWGETVLHATYLINRLPSSILNWETPYKLLYKKEPIYSNIRCFGCQCFCTDAVTSQKLCI